MALLAVNTRAYQRFRRTLKLPRSRLSRSKDISDSPDRVQLRLVWIHFGAQAVDEHVHDVGLRIETVVPHMFQDHGFGHRPTRMAHQILEQGKLARLEFDGFGPTRDLARQQVEREGADRELRGFG